MNYVPTAPSVAFRWGIGCLIMAVLIAAQASEPIGWHEATAPLMTRWAAEVGPNNVLPEYPRPQLVRADWMNLNGLWDYAITTNSVTEPPPFAFGKWTSLREGDAVHLLSAGNTLSLALEAADQLANEKIKASVHSCASVKPLAADEASCGPTGKAPAISILSSDGLRPCARKIAPS